MMKKTLPHPLAITMWDFSWLERRWPGAGYEDWDQVLDELKLRGYDAVRIDAYPHLLAADPEREWTLRPVWNVQDWGAPALTKINHVAAHLISFIRLCRERNIQVALSTWFREDADNTRMNIKSAEDMAHIWIAVLRAVEQAGLLDNILYVDLCNEFPLQIWCPFLGPALGVTDSDISRMSPEAIAWMRDSIGLVREAYPQLDYCYSFCTEYDTIEAQDVSYMDVLEPHVWMTAFSDFYDQVGYRFDRFNTASYENLAEKGEKLYRSNPEHWQNCLYTGIERMALWSRLSGKPLITTECWGIVDYKDWPLLNWDWVAELCELGTRKAAETGRWTAIATSNFCGPQFSGMWRDVEWHRKMTDIIHSAKLPR